MPECRGDGPFHYILLRTNVFFNNFHGRDAGRQVAQQVFHDKNEFGLAFLCMCVIMID